MNYPVMLPNTLRKLEWCMSPSQFDEDWPPASLENDGVWHFGPKGERIGYGTALTKSAAEAQRQQIREKYIRVSSKLAWC